MALIVASAPPSWGYQIPPGKTIIHATNNEGDVNKDVHADVVLLGDAGLGLCQLIEAIHRQGSWQTASPIEEIAARKGAWLTEWRPKLTSNEVPLNPYRVLHDLMQVVDRRRTIIPQDSGMPRDQMAPFWETLIPRGFPGWGKSTQLGSSLGFALGEPSCTRQTGSPVPG